MRRQRDSSHGDGNASGHSSSDGSLSRPASRHSASPSAGGNSHGLRPVRSGNTPTRLDTSQAGKTVSSQRTSERLSTISAPATSRSSRSDASGKSSSQQHISPGKAERVSRSRSPCLRSSSKSAGKEQATASESKSPARVSLRRNSREKSDGALKHSSRLESSKHATVPGGTSGNPADQPFSSSLQSTEVSSGIASSSPSVCDVGTEDVTAGLAAEKPTTGTSTDTTSSPTDSIGFGSNLSVNLLPLPGGCNEEESKGYPEVQCIEEELGKHMNVAMGTSSNGQAPILTVEDTAVSTGSNGNGKSQSTPASDVAAAQILEDTCEAEVEDDISRECDMQAGVEGAAKQPAGCAPSAPSPALSNMSASSVTSQKAGESGEVRRSSRATKTSWKDRFSNAPDFTAE